jgi:hypothetical protein
MPQSVSRVQNKERESSPEDWIDTVVIYLNAGRREVAGDTVDARALLLVVKRLQAIEARISSLQREQKAAWKRHPDPELVKLTSAINRFLCRYTAQPSLARVEPRTLQHWPIIWTPVGTKKGRYIELRLVLEIISIAQAGRISSLKQCEQCRKWLLARFSHQRFCSEGCKEQFHRSNEADKKRRRDWARKNYWLHKNKHVK